MTRARGAAALLACLIAVAGCGGGDDAPAAKKPAAHNAQHASGRSSSEQVVRGWIAALNARKYGKAADYFARGAVVQQTVPVRLGTRKSAIAFNKSLPCRGKVTEVRAEAKSVLFTVRLFDGPGGRCEPSDGSVASARVRCVIRHGRFLAWRQLPEGQGVPKSKSA
jgi:hypothetical protein